MMNSQHHQHPIPFYPQFLPPPPVYSSHLLAPPPPPPPPPQHGSQFMLPPGYIMTPYGPMQHSGGWNQGASQQGMMMMMMSGPGMVSGPPPPPNISMWPPPPSLPLSAPPPSLPSAQAPRPHFEAKSQKRRREETAAARESASSLDPLSMAYAGEKLIVDGRSYEKGDRGVSGGGGGGGGGRSGVEIISPTSLPLPVQITTTVSVPSIPPVVSSLLPQQREVLVTTAGMRALAPSIARRTTTSSGVGMSGMMTVTPKVFATTSSTIAASVTSSSGGVFIPPPTSSATAAAVTAIIRPSAPGPIGATLLQRPSAPPLLVEKVKIDVVDADVAAFLKDLET